MILSVLRSSPQFSPEYVTRLRDGLAWFTGQPLVCISDVEIPGIARIPLEDDWPRWWPKMKLFDPCLEFDGMPFLPGQRLVYFDLDSVIVGDPSPLLEYEGALAITRDFNLREHREVPGLPAIGSTVILWRHGYMQPVWDAFIADPEKAIAEHPKRMDHFIRKHLPPCDYVQDIFPGLVQCMKTGFAKHYAPSRFMASANGAAVVTTWGNPRLHELPTEYWLRKEWEGSA